MSREPNAWELRLRENLEHSAWYVERFRTMAREDLLLGSWDLRPFTDESSFVVAVLSRR